MIGRSDSGTCARPTKTMFPSQLLIGVVAQSRGKAKRIGGMQWRNTEGLPPRVLRAQCTEKRLGRFVRAKVVKEAKSRAANKRLPSVFLRHARKARRSQRKSLSASMRRVKPIGF